MTADIYKTITKKVFIERFKDIPDDALILCIPVKNDPIPNIIGAWKNDSGEISIRQVNNWAHVEPMSNDMIIRHFKP